MRKPPHVVEIFLQPGEFYFGDKDTRVRTILGSCVAVTMWHPTRLIGGMCHYMLPARAGAPAGELDGRYAHDAIRMFLREIRAAGTEVAQYQVKLFGAGNMFPGVRKRHGARAGLVNVADKNISSARELVASHGLRVAAEDMGGVGRREVLFDIWSGHAWVRQTPVPAAMEKET